MCLLGSVIGSRGLLSSTIRSNALLSEWVELIMLRQTLLAFSSFALELFSGLLKVLEVARREKLSCGRSVSG